MTPPKQSPQVEAQFEAIWSVIKNWDIRRDHDCGASWFMATGDDVRTILKALGQAQQFKDEDIYKLGVSHGMSQQPRQEPWTCPECNAVNGAHLKRCHEPDCQTPRQEPALPPGDKSDSGLAIMHSLEYADGDCGETPVDIARSSFSAGRQSLRGELDFAVKMLEEESATARKLESLLSTAQEREKKLIMLLNRLYEDYERGLLHEPHLGLWPEVLAVLSPQAAQGEPR